MQEATNFPLRPNVLPFLRSHLPLLQREVNSSARASKQSALQYVRSNDSSVIELLYNPTDAHNDIFLSNESSSGSNGLNLKRRATEAWVECCPISIETVSTFCSVSHLIRLLYESHLTGGNLSHEWSDYISPAKRPHHSLMLSSSALPHLINHPSLFEYQNGIHSHQEQMVSIQKRKNKTLAFLWQMIEGGVRWRRGVTLRAKEWARIHVNVRST